MPLWIGLRLLDSDAITPLRNVAVEVWQADASGRYSGYARAEPHADGTLLAAVEMPTEQIAPEETFLRGSQRTDDAGTCPFQTIWPGLYFGLSAASRNEPAGAQRMPGCRRLYGLRWALRLDGY